MEPEDEITYLKFYNYEPNSFLSHNNESEALNDGVPVESIFTEIDQTKWPTAITETDESQTSSHYRTDPHLDNTIFLSSIDENGMIISNAFLQTYDNDVEIIQLMDVDGRVRSIDKSALVGSSTVEKNPIDFSNFFTEVVAMKCKFCAALFGAHQEIIAHLKSAHSQNLQGLNSTESQTVLINNLVKIDTTSAPSVNDNENEKVVMYLCSDCANAFPSKEVLKKHMVESHDFVEDTETKAQEFDSELESLLDENSSMNLNLHLLKNQQKQLQKIKCSVQSCVQRFTSNDLQLKHVECHVPENHKQFRCPTCQKMFSIWRICCLHLWNQHAIDAGLVSCPMCDKFKALSITKVANHMAIHKEEKPFLCSECGKRYKQYSQLRNHQIVHKPKKELPNSYALKQCKSCERVFTSSKSLRNHIKFVHEKFKPFICSICGHQTSRKEMLQVHFRQHTGDKPFHCTYCDYKSGDRNCLRKHTMRHLGMIKYKCPYCTYTSIQTSSYKTHLASRHPGKSGTYKCSICRYTTVNIDLYSAHVKGHTLEEKEKEALTSNENGQDSEMIEDDEVQNLFTNTDQSDDTVDTGGITIPAEVDQAAQCDFFN